MTERLSLKAAWPMYVLGGVLAAVTVALAYVLLVVRWLEVRDQYVSTNWIGRGLWVLAAGGATIAAFRAVREESRDRDARIDAEAADRRAAREREDRRAEEARAAREHAVDDGPFRSAPQATPVVIAAPPAPAPAAPPVEVVAGGDGSAPRLLT